MDGNGRWARRRLLPRFEGHRAGATAARDCVRACAEAGIEYLTLFAFSSENWARPADEVGQLLTLFEEVLEREADELAEHGVRLRCHRRSERLSPPAARDDGHASSTGPPATPASPS